MSITDLFMAEVAQGSRAIIPTLGAIAVTIGSLQIAYLLATMAKPMSVTIQTSQGRERGKSDQTIIASEEQESPGLR